jgi:hypothetical protein
MPIIEKLNPSHSDFNKENNIFVVSRKIKTEIDYDTDEDDSLSRKSYTNNSMTENKAYQTPLKKKSVRYYS